MYETLIQKINSITLESTDNTDSQSEYLQIDRVREQMPITYENNGNIMISNFSSVEEMKDLYQRISFIGMEDVREHLYNIEAPMDEKEISFDIPSVYLYPLLTERKIKILHKYNKNGQKYFIKLYNNREEEYQDEIYLLYILKTPFGSSLKGICLDQIFKNDSIKTIHIKDLDTDAKYEIILGKTK